MIRRLISLLFLAWVLGFAWFAPLPPMPAPTQQKTDAIVVLTGGPGRIDRAPELLEAGQAKRLLVSGGTREVKPPETHADYQPPMHMLDRRLDRQRLREGTGWADAVNRRWTRINQK